MPNLNAPRGFVPSRYLDGSSWNGAANTYYIDQADTNIMSPGDAVKSSTLTDINGVPGITKALGTDTVRGVIIGFMTAPWYGNTFSGTNLDLTLQNIPATKTKSYYALVVDDPSMVFELQDNGLSVIASTSMNKNFTFTVANPTAPAVNSATVLLNSSVGTANTLNLRLIGAMQRDDNDRTSVNAKWLVRFNQHELMGGTAGV